MLNAIKSALCSCMPQGFIGEIRVDSVGTEAYQQAVMMNFTCLTGFQHQANLRALMMCVQMMMHAANRKQRANRNAIGARFSVRQNYQAFAICYCLASLCIDALERCC